MLRSIPIIKPRTTNLAYLAVSTILVLSQTHPSVALAAAAPAGSEPTSDIQQQNAQQETTGEVSIKAERQTALAKQAMTISETPDASPQSKQLSVVVGLGPAIAPAYLGSKKTNVGVLPYVDIRGLLGGRVYLSSAGGLGVNLVNTSSFRAGLNASPAGGRKSKDDPHLKGLPDIGMAAAIGGFMAYSYKSFGFEATVARRIGSHPGTDASVGTTFIATPMPNLQLTLSTSLTWTSSLNTFFGISPADAARAAAVGNPLPPYSAGSGVLGAGATIATVYQFGNHWALVNRLGLIELIGHSVRDSPLTQRSFQPNFVTGVLYVF
jgi:MipA family protein